MEKDSSAYDTKILIAVRGRTSELQFEYIYCLLIIILSSGIRSPVKKRPGHGQHKRTCIAVSKIHSHNATEIYFDWTVRLDKPG